MINLQESRQTLVQDTEGTKGYSIIACTIYVTRQRYVLYRSPCAPCMILPHHNDCKAAASEAIPTTTVQYDAAELRGSSVRLSLLALKHIPSLAHRDSQTSPVLADRGTCLLGKWAGRILASVRSAIFILQRLLFMQKPSGQRDLPY